ncbi:hypothetical protein FOZ76_19715 [Verticiella sediminum]|uniref:Uncharacterized protein n=1 Tax=Verticiella sediminum TaxID=1247510 RepID=A0A556AB15_9BURK|nr:hypothetical protein [Verticiella sediminum]TSH90079.1 hypothetical protein FOZ76_19715 [Verticiella sediminum]
MRRYRLGLITPALGGTTLRQFDVKEVARPLISLNVAGPAMLLLPPAHLLSVVRARLLATARAIRSRFGAD